MGYSAFMDYREVLVTGGTGFVGSHVCRALIARGWLPRLLARVGSEGRIPEDIRNACRVTLGDVTNRESVDNAVQGTEAVVHLAGIIREFPDREVTFDRLHLAATRNVVDAAKRWGIPRIVHMSALGAQAGGPTAYFDSKGRAEDYVRQSGLRWTVFRPSVIFGPGDRFLQELVGILRRTPLFPVPGDGTYRLQPVFVGDVARGIAEAVEREDTEGRIFEVGGPDRFSYDELIDKVSASQGRRVRKVHVPLPLVRAVVRRLERTERFPLTTEQIEMLFRESLCDGKPFYAAFGFPPFSLSDYLSSRFRAPHTFMGVISEKGAEPEGGQAASKGVSAGEKEHPLRKSA